MKKRELTEKKQESLKTFQNFKATYPNLYRWLKIIAIIAIAVSFVIWGLFIFGNKIWGIPTNFSAGELLGFYGSFLAFLGTVALGALALWQNERIQNANEQAQSILTEQNKKLVEINERMMKLEESNNQLAQSSSIYIESESVDADAIVLSKEDFIIDDNKHFNLFISGSNPQLYKKFIDLPPKSTDFNKVIFKIKLYNYSEILTRKISVEADTTLRYEQNGTVYSTGHDIVSFGVCQLFSCVSKSDPKDFELVLYLPKDASYHIEHVDISGNNHFRFIFNFESSFRVITTGVLIFEYNEIKKQYEANYVFNGIKENE